MSKWLKNKIRNWLGISALEGRYTDLEYKFLAVNARYERMERTWEHATAELTDLHVRGGNTRVVVASNLGHGFSKWSEMEFRNVRELNDFCENINSMQVRSFHPHIDAQRDIKMEITEDRRKRGVHYEPF